MGDNRKKPERQFHDSWAFILFLLFSIVLNTFYIYNTSNIVQVTTKFYGDYKIGQLLAGNLGFTFIMILVSLLLCHFIPKILIIISILLVPAATIIGWMYGAKDTDYSTTVGTIIFIFDLIFIIIASIVILAHIDYIAKVISLASLIFFKNILGILLVVSFVTVMFILLSLPSMLVDSTDDTVQKIRYVQILQTSWQFFISLYFIQVFISSVIASEIQKDNNIFGTAFSNSCYALGSVSFGALLVAVITTLQAMVQDLRQRNRENGARPNLLSQIMASIAEVLLDILGDIVKFANAIAFPYLSVNGTCYEESVVKSFQVLTSSGFEKVASISGVGFVVFTMILLFVLSSISFNYFIYLDMISLTGDFKQNLGISIITTILFAFVFGMIFNLLRSAILALIYTSISMPEETKQYDPEFIEIINEKKKLFEPVSAESTKQSTKQPS